MDSLTNKILPSKLVCLTDSEDVRKAFDRVSLLKIKDFPVIDSRKHFVGLVSFEDLESAACSLYTGCKVHDLEKRPVEIVSLETPLKKILWRMLNENISAFAVEKNGTFVALLRHEDLLRMVMKLIMQRPEGLEILKSQIYRLPIGEVSHFFSEVGI